MFLVPTCFCQVRAEARCPQSIDNSVTLIHEHTFAHLRGLLGGFCGEHEPLVGPEQIVGVIVWILVEPRKILDAFRDDHSDIGMYGSGMDVGINVSG
ncbi:hypothetical protein [Corynebacterium oculi]|uniref:hypothetical protein n=1 Tax=Corynebacterium oculi TaxID=1544416 RepID=UPI0006D88E7E|nr:hypothetical protein [Corynebacterium oculi]